MADIDAYLQKHGFFRLWQLVQQKYVSLGRVAGRVLLQSVTEEEREAIAGLLAVNLHGYTDVSVSLQDLDRALRASGFEVSLEECLARLYPNDLTPIRDQKTAEAERYRQFVHWASSIVDNEVLKTWIEAMGAPGGQPYGYRTFLRCYREDCDRETGMSTPVANALVALNRRLKESATTVRLPILAAQVTGNPHGLDADTLAGRLFQWGLMGVQQIRASDPTIHYADVNANEIASSEQDPDSDIVLSAAFIRDLYADFGVVLDDISSIVYVAGWQGLSEAPVALTLFTIASLEHDGKLALCARESVETPKVVFVVENPSVLGAIVDSATALQRRLPHPIVCVSGQPSIAAFRLLDVVWRAGGTIYYSGDMDVKGLQIAEALALRYDQRLLPWRMSSNDYVDGLLENSPTLTKDELRQLTTRPLPWEVQADHHDESSPKLEAVDGGTVKQGQSRFLRLQMLHSGRKVFQENLVSQLIADYWNQAPGGTSRERT